MTAVLTSSTVEGLPADSGACARQVVLLLDADFVVSTGLHERLSKTTEFQALVQDTADQRNAIVLPAFETEASLGMDQGSQVARQAQLSALHAQALACLVYMLGSSGSCAQVWCKGHSLAHAQTCLAAFGPGVKRSNLQAGACRQESGLHLCL